MSKDVTCPNCGSEHIIAITYAYHDLVRHGRHVVFDHFDWSDEYALQCRRCDWTHGDPSTPSSNKKLPDVLGEADE